MKHKKILRLASLSVRLLYSGSMGSTYGLVDLPEAVVDAELAGLVKRLAVMLDPSELLAPVPHSVVYHQRVRSIIIYS